MTNTEPSYQPPEEPPVKKPVHYRLTFDEWRRSAKQFKPAELKVLYYLRTLDPFGDRWLDVQVTTIADDLGMNKGTVSRALRVLAEEREIDLEIQTARVRLFSFTHRLSVDNRLSTDNLLCTDNSGCVQTTQVVCTQPELSVHNNPPPEPSPEADSGTSHTIHTYSNSSNKEREARSEALPVENLVRGAEEDSLEIDTAYKEWLRNKAQKLPSPPVLIEQWIASESLKSTNQKQFLQEMRKLPQGTSIPPPPSRFQIETAVISALGVGDRLNAQARLQGLWQDGQREVVEAMVQEFPQWGFVVDEEGVSDADG